MGNVGIGRVVACWGHATDVGEPGVTDARVVCAADVEKETGAVGDAECEGKANRYLVEANLYAGVNMNGCC